MIARQVGERNRSAYLRDVLRRDLEESTLLRVRDMSGLLRLPMEVTNATDEDATGDQEDAI